MGIELIIGLLAASAGSGAAALGAGHFASSNIDDPAGLREVMRQNGWGSVADHIPG